MRYSRPRDWSHFRSGRCAWILHPRGVGRATGPMVHGPSAHQQRRANLGVALDVESREGEGRAGRTRRCRTRASAPRAHRGHPGLGPSPPRATRAWHHRQAWRSEFPAPPTRPHPPWHRATCAREPAASKANSSLGPSEGPPHPPLILRSALFPPFPTFAYVSTRRTLYLGIHEPPGESVGHVRNRQRFSPWARSPRSESCNHHCAKRLRAVAGGERRHDERMSDGARRVTEQTATLLWEACRRYPDPAAVRRALAGGADPAWAARAASDQRIGALVWRALGAAGSLDSLGPDRITLGDMVEALKMEAVLLLPRAVALAVGPLTDGRAGARHLQGPSGGGTLPRAGHATNGRHRPPSPSGRSPARARGAGPRRVAGDVPRCRRPLRHRPEPSRGSVLLARGPLRPGGTIRTADGTRFGHSVGPATTSPVRRHAGVRIASSRGDRRAGRSCGKAAPPVRAARLDCGPGHDRRARRGAAHCDRLGTVLDVARAARCATVVGVALAMAERTGLDGPLDSFPLPATGGAAMPCVGCYRSPGR